MENFWRSISADEAKKLVAQKNHDENFCILDVRTEEEFLSGAVPGAINLDFYAPDFLEELGKLDKNKTHLIYCRSGSRSKAVLFSMKQLGFACVYELDGGIISF
jgi:rhodanese-related sulfurtransferase